MNGTLTQSKPLKTDQIHSSVKLHLPFPTLMVLAALAAFELFTYSVARFSLNTLLGLTPQEGQLWSASLAVGICVIDWVGILYLTNAPLFPRGTNTGHWILAVWLTNGIANLLITWWGLSTAIAIQALKTGLVIDAGLLIKVVPAFLAVLLTLIRVLLIGVLARAIHLENTLDSSSALSLSSQSTSGSQKARILLEAGSIIPPEDFIPFENQTKTLHRPTFRQTPVQYRYH